MKKFLITTLAIIAISFTVSAETPDQTVPAQEEPITSLFALQYQFQTFDDAKASGSYGFAVFDTSCYTKGDFHIGYDIGLGMNYGLIKPGGLIYEIGPSGRIDISKRVFINMPVNLMLYYSKKAYWGMRVAPSLMAFVSKNVGVFVGPQLAIGFNKCSDTTVGMQFGLAFNF